ncbi:MAG TPA: wax ester/triacylglycerol synthase domain-containing protein [Solirubrobacterales bacterium]|jgi:WS/DGAT/MGAT family acyltransferase|nr:wax ester/triacylglycerol synthase domain-containing protein [Solirubrobacterales bacterium]
MTGVEPEPLRLDDVRILDLESDAIKGHTGKLFVLEPAGGPQRLDVKHLRRRVAERLPGLEPLRRRVEAPRRGGPVWVEDPEIDLDWHVAEHEVAEPLDDEAFRAAAGRILAERLDRGRPLWRLDLVPLAAGRTGLVGRLHHAMADGVTAIRLAAGLLWDEPGGPAATTSASPAADTQPPGPDSQPAPAKVAPEAEHRERPLLVRLPGTLRRELRRGRDTVLDRHIGSEREIAWTVVPLQRLKAIGRAAGEGITVNDVVLAVVAGGLRGWLASVGGRPDDLRAQVPVCLHLREGGTEIANRDSFLNVDLPVSEPNPVARLHTINAETSEAKLDHDADTLYSFFHALGRFRPLYSGVTRVVSGPREFALSVSNVPGPPERPMILGHELREFCSFAEPADRHALRVAVISLGGDLAFGLCSDPEAIGDLDHLADALGQAVGELEAAV